MNFMVRRAVTAAILIFLFAWVPVRADHESASFNDAFDLLQSGEYLSAYNSLLQLTETYSGSRNIDKYLFFRSKAAWYAGLYTESRMGLERLIGAYPTSSYVPYGYYFLGNVNYRLEQVGPALDAYIKAYNSSNDKRLTDLAVKALIGMVADYGSQASERIIAAPIPSGRRCDLLVKLARELFSEKNYQPIKSLLSSCQSAEAHALQTDAEQYVKQKAEIAAVLPLSGEMQTYGDAILNGIKLRVEQCNDSSGMNVKSVVYDTEGQTLEAARIIRRLSAEDVGAVIGPLTSEATAVASAALSCGDMPMIAPAAGQADLTELSSTCFQLTPNLDWQGVRMADLAIDYLGADTAAIMTPTSPENLSMARAFADRFKARGGHILAVEYFRVRETDFGPFVKDIKSLILGELLDSLIFINEQGDTIDPEEVPVWIDCIYIPAEATQLRLLLPQIQFYNLKTALLGADGWGQKLVYDLGENVLGMHYFTSSRIIDDESERVRQFYFDFDKRFGHQPGRLEALGYDAASLLCDAFANGNFSREDIARYLSSIKGYHGVAGDVSFGSNRENVDLPVYRIEYGRPQRVDFSLGKK